MVDQSVMSIALEIQLISLDIFLSITPLSIQSARKIGPFNPLTAGAAYIRLFVFHISTLSTTF